MISRLAPPPLPQSAPVTEFPPPPDFDRLPDFHDIPSGTGPWENYHKISHATYSIYKAIGPMWHGPCCTETTTTPLTRARVPVVNWHTLFFTEWIGSLFFSLFFSLWANSLSKSSHRIIASILARVNGRLYFVRIFLKISNGYPARSYYCWNEKMRNFESCSLSRCSSWNRG